MSGKPALWDLESHFLALRLYETGLNESGGNSDEVVAQETLFSLQDPIEHTSSFSPQRVGHARTQPDTAHV